MDFWIPLSERLDYSKLCGSTLWGFKWRPSVQKTMWVKGRKINAEVVKLNLIAWDNYGDRRNNNDEHGEYIFRPGDNNFWMYRCTRSIIASLNLFEQFCKPPSCASCNGSLHCVSHNNEDEGHKHWMGNVDALDLTPKLASNKSTRQYSVCESGKLIVKRSHNIFLEVTKYNNLSLRTFLTGTSWINKIGFYFLQAYKLKAIGPTAWQFLVIHNIRSGVADENMEQLHRIDVN